jgi:hypothetical protein
MIRLADVEAGKLVNTISHPWEYFRANLLFRFVHLKSKRGEIHILAHKMSAIEIAPTIENTALWLLFC